MMNFKRNNDLSEVFDQKYKANHGNNEIVNQNKKNFDLKMFGIRDKEDIRKELRKANSVQSQVNNLNQRMNALNPNMSNVNMNNSINTNSNGSGNIKGFNNLRNNRF